MIAPTVLTNGAVNTGSAVTTTASVTPSTSGVQFVWTYAVKGSAFTDTTTISGNGRTWVKIQSGISGNNVWALWVGYGAAPTAGTIVITFSGTPTGGRYAVAQQAGLPDVTINPVLSSATNSGTGTTGTVTLTTGLSRQYSFWGHNATEATTPDATSNVWTEYLDDAASSWGTELQWEESGSDPTCTATWASNVFWQGAAVVLKAPVYAGEMFDGYLEGKGHIGVMYPESSLDDDAWAIIDA